MQEKAERTYDPEERLLQFSARIIRLVEELPNTRTGNHVANRLLGSGTSPYANHAEVRLRNPETILSISCAFASKS